MQQRAALPQAKRYFCALCEIFVSFAVAIFYREDRKELPQSAPGILARCGVFHS
jgi:hypothetical protein